MPVTERFARSVTAYRHRWAAGAFAVFVGCVVLSLHLSLRENLRDFQPRSRGPADPTEIAVRRLVGGADRVVVVLESDTAMQVNVMAPLLDVLAGRLAAVPGVHAVQYRIRPELRGFIETRAPAYVLFAFDTNQLAALGRRLGTDSIRRLVQATDAPDAHALAGARFARGIDPLRVLAPAAAVLQRAAGGANLRLDAGYLALPGKRGFLFIVEPEPSASVDSARTLVLGVERAMREVAADVRFASLMRGQHLLDIGRPVAVVHVLRTAFQDVARVAIASLVLSFVLQLLLFRRMLAPVLLAGTVVFGVALTGAVATVVFGSLSLVGWLFISVLVGLGDEFGLYILSHYWISGTTGADRASALASALARPGRGLIYSGLAMAAAFGSLALMSYPVMFEVACVTALGLLAMLVSSFTVLPIALAYTEPRRAGATMWVRGMTLADRAGSRHPRRWLCGWFLLVVGCFWAAHSLQFEPHPWKVALRGNPATADLERVRLMLGVWPSPILMVSSGATEREALERDREAVYQLDRVGSRAGVVTIESLSRWLPTEAQQSADLNFLRSHRDAFSPERIRRDFLAAVGTLRRPDPRLTTEYLPRVLSVLRTSERIVTIDSLRALGLDSIVGHHIVHDGRRTLAVSYVYLAQSPWTAGVTDRFEETVRMGEGDALVRSRFIGDALRGASHASQLRHDIILATLAAFVMVGILLLVQFRKPIPAVLCLLPLVCGIAASLGAMALLGIELNVLTLSIAPLMVGLCVDDGIHLVERFERGENRLDVLRDSGAAIIITTLTTVTGFACLVFARFPGVRELGLIGSIGIMVALAASLQLVPMCYAMWRSRHVPAPVGGSVR